MSESVLKSQIIDWLKVQDYWLQYAGNKLLQGDDLTGELLEATYIYFKEQYGLKDAVTDQEDIKYPDIETDSIEALQLQLLSIKGIEYVNALAKDQQIKIGPNLTIVYGDNGAGKSGYVRLLNNAFNSRGDKQILGNVFDRTSTGAPTCKFTFKGAGEPYDLEYPSDKTSKEFSQYSIYDSTALRVHLENDNKLNFTPVGFQFFEQVLELFEELKEKLASEIQLNKPTNSFTLHFNNENEIKEIINLLSADSDIKKILELSDIKQSDVEKSENLQKKKAELIALDIPKKLVELQKTNSLLETLISNEEQVLSELRKDKIEYYKGLISSYASLKKLAKEEGIASLEKYTINNVESEEWKEFIIAARKYVNLINASKQEHDHYPNENDKCILCLQPLTDRENELVHTYWKLLKSQAEIELNKTKGNITAALKSLRSLPIVVFDESSALFDQIKNISPDLVIKWKGIIGKTEETKKFIIDNLTKCSLDNSTTSFDDVASDLISINGKINQSIEILVSQNVTQELEQIEKDLKYITDKELVHKLKDQILEFINKHKWARKAEGLINTFRTNSITSKQGTLFTEHVSESFLKSFNQECKLFNAPQVDIIQRNAKASTLRKLQVAGEAANRVLSEGEQRGISLADFLTESILNPENKGIIFDDPVTSLDHARRDVIAERLVNEAKNRQVIVFTHDIVFLLLLQNYAVINTVACELQTIRKIHGIPGISKPELPWIAQNVSSREGWLKQELVRITKFEKTADPEDYKFGAKKWCGLLRESWERCVEERLFKGVVTRFSFGIESQKLKKVLVTSDLIDDINAGMTKTSKWVHDQAAGLNTPTPTPQELEKLLSEFSVFIKDKCKAA